MWVSISTAQHSGHIGGKHLGVASRNHYLIFVVGNTAGELFPTIYILNLIEEKHGAFIAQLAVNFQYKVKVIDSHSGQALILKIQIYYLIPTMAVGNELLYSSI